MPLEDPCPGLRANCILQNASQLVSTSPSKSSLAHGSIRTRATSRLLHWPDHLLVCCCHVCLCLLASAYLIACELSSMHDRGIIQMRWGSLAWTTLSIPADGLQPKANGSAWLCSTELPWLPSRTVKSLMSWKEKVNWVHNYRFCKTFTLREMKQDATKATWCPWYNKLFSYSSACDCIKCSIAGVLPSEDDVIIDLTWWWDLWHLRLAHVDATKTRFLLESEIWPFCAAIQAIHDYTISFWECHLSAFCAERADWPGASAKLEHS